MPSAANGSAGTNMEPAYWEMRRIAQNVPANTPEAEYAELELSPPPVRPLGPETDADAQIPSEEQDVPLLSLECGRVEQRGGWRVLRPLAAP